MGIVGIILIVVGLGALGFGIFKHLHAKKILAAPFARTSSVPAATLGPKGAISTEGAAEARELLIAPCSGTPCLYYELVAYQKWEEVEHTEDGEKKKTGRDKHEEQKLGMAFSLNDGSGPVTVDGREGIAGCRLVEFIDARRLALQRRCRLRRRRRCPPGRRCRGRQVGVEGIDMRGEVGQ